MDRTLIEWGADPSKLDDGELVPPSRDAIQLAFQIATDLRDTGAEPPDRIVPNGDGGITVETWSGSLSEMLEIIDGRTFEYRRFDGSRLVERQVVTL